MSIRRTWSMQSLPPAGRWAIYIGLAVAFAIACVFLARWQFDRNEERSAEMELVEQNYSAPAVPLDDLIGTDGRFDEDDRWRQVSLDGRYLTDDQLLVRNRPHGSTSAYEVLVPFETVDGRLFVVNRGWVLPGESAEEAVPVPDAPAGEVTVIARLQPGEPLPSSGRSAPEGQVPTIHLPLVAEQTGLAVITEAYGAMVSEVPAPATAPEAFPEPSEDPGPHLSYAIQWILFGIMGLIFIIYVIRSERRSDPDDGQPAKPTRKRRDRDADDEDSILDAAEAVS